MFVNHKGTRLISFPVKMDAKSVHEEVTLFPGLNEVSEEVLEQMKKHPTMKHLFEGDDENDGELEIVEEAGKAVESLKGLKAAKAKQLIKGSASLDQLQKWLDEEKRADVKKALQAQIDAIKAPASVDSDK